MENTLENVERTSSKVKIEALMKVAPTVIFSMDVNYRFLTKMDKCFVGPVIRKERFLEIDNIILAIIIKAVKSSSVRAS